MRRMKDVMASNTRGFVEEVRADRLSFLASCVNVSLPCR